jgi:hypothetical protein
MHMFGRIGETTEDLQNIPGGNIWNNYFRY